MGSDWEEILLGEVAESIQTGPFGSLLYKKDYVLEGIPSIMPVNIGDNRITTNGIARISQEDAFRLTKYLVKTGDVVYSRRGDVERRALVREREDGWLCGTGCLRVRFDVDTVSPEFASFQLGGPVAREWIVRHAIGATMPNLNTSILSAVPFSLPPLPEQRAIAHILGSLDDKIELNRQMNATLEGMAQALFKSWFVDFDPVIDNALAAGNPIPEELADRAEVRRTALADGTANREAAKPFPAGFQHTEELGWIPEGWKTNTIEELAKQIAMGPFGSNIKVSTFVDEGIPVISGQHLKDTLLTDSTFNYVTPEHAGKLARSNVFPGDIIFTHAGSIGQVSLIPKDAKFQRYVISQRQFYLRCDEERTKASYITYFFKSYIGQHVLLANASQTGVPSLARPSSYLKSIEVVSPTLKLLEMFDEFVRGGHAGIRLRISEVNAITKLRDTLLPKLISGEMRIPDAEKLAEEALE